MLAAMFGSSGTSPLRSRLRPGERVLWEGQPDVWVFSMRGAWYLIPFSLLWGGFAIFWEVMAVSTGAPFFFWLWGIPFVAIGLYMIFGRIFVARREAARTHYAITDRRVLVQSGAFRPTFTELDLRDLPASQLEERSDGLGTITLGPPMGFMRLPPGWPMGGMYGRPPALEAIPQVGRVYETLQDAKAAAREGRSGA
jgi:hypothetical protein